MAAYIIGYDLNKSGQDYEELITAIKSISGTWWHHLDSTWIVVTSKTAVQIRDLLLSHIDTNDELLVAKLSGEAAWYGINEKGSNWLRSNLNN